MNTDKGIEAPTGGGERFARAFEQMREQDAIQFREVEMPAPETQPDWLREALDWIAEALQPLVSVIVSIWPVLMWVLIAIGVALLALLVYRLIDPTALRRKPAGDDDRGWTPDQTAALALLEEADRLAALGQFDAATHLLLQRSVGQIAEARPDLVEPSSTARELAAEQRLPDTARKAFAIIASRVERSLFALRQLDAGDWHAARSAYADFALAQQAIAR